MKKMFRSKKFKILSLVVLAMGIVFANLSIFGAAVLKLQATPSYANKRIDLNWNVEGGDTNGYSYKVYKKESNGTFQPISSVDFTNELEVVNVLNVYPETAGIPRVTFNYNDGTTQTLPKSAAMKVWMEGGSMVQDGVTTTFAPIGINPYNARQLIRVTPVASGAFNSNPAMIWNYDVVMFGTWDTNGSADDQPNAAAVTEITKFLDAGFGVVAGHDSIGYSYQHGLNAIRQRFGIETGCWGGVDTKTENYDWNANWGYTSTTATVVTNDVLTSYPWNLPVGTKLTIPTTHTCANAATGIVAMQLTDGTEYSDTITTANYPGSGNPYYYVARNNNAVMVQTGHSNCQSTEDERKVLANAVFYLKQMTELNYSMDNNVADSAAPAAVTASNINRNGTSVSMNLSRVDNGTTYEYYVEGVNKMNGTKLTSSTTKAVYTSEVKGYSYVVDNNATTDVDGTIEATSSSITATIGNGPKTYLHIRAIDNAGNVGPVQHILLHTNIAPTLSVSQNITKWTNTDVVLTATGADTDGRVVSIKKPDNSTANAASTTYTVGQNGTYTFVATDNSGATATKSITITNIDKVQPDGYTTGTTQPTATNRYAVINFKATDDASGVAKIVKPDGTEVKIAAQQQLEATTTYNVTVPGNYTFTVHDHAGNSKTVTIPVTIVSDGLEIKFIDQVTKEEIATKKTGAGNVGQAYTTSPENVEGYQLVLIPDNASGNLTMDKITVTYEYRKNSNVIAKYIDENYNTNIINDVISLYKEGDPYTTEEKSFTGYQLTGKTENTSGTVVRDDITVIYRYKKISQGIEVRFIDQVTKQEIADRVTKTGLEKDAYTTEAKEIADYELMVTPDNANGNMAVDKIVITYEYRNKSNVTTKYIDENYGTKIVDDVVIEYLEEDNYSTEQKNIEGYQLTSKTNNISGTIARQDIVVEYRYKKISEGVETKFIDQVTGEEIGTPVHQGGLEKDAYTTASKEISGYELVKVPTNNSGQMTVAKTVVTYEYRLLSDVVTKYIDINTGNKIVPNEVASYKEGDSYTTEEKILIGYELVDKTSNIVGTMGRQDIEVTYQYKRIAQGVEAIYVDQTTGLPITASVVLKGLENQSYTTSAKTVDGYVLVKTPNNANGKMSVDKITVRYEYRKLSNIVAKYIDVNSNTEITPEVVQTLKEGDKYETEAKSFDGYQLINNPSNKKGTLARSNIEVVYNYKKIAGGVEVKFIDQVTKAEIAEKQVYNGLEKDNYSTSAKNIKGYQLVKTPTNKNGEMTVDKITVTYEYRIVLNVTTKHIDANSKEEIVAPVVVNYKEGDPYTTVAKDLAGYILVKSPDAPNGTMGRESVVVTYEYKMISDGLVVKYIDEATNDLLDMETYNGNENDVITLEEKTFDTYTLSKRPSVSQITLTVKPQEARFYYKKLVTMTVKGIDAITGEELYSTTQSGIEGQEYTTAALNMPGYVLVTTPDNANGVYSRDNTEVVYEYKRVSPGVIVRYIDKDNNETLDVVTITGFVGEAYTTEKKEFEKYDFVTLEGVPNGKLTETKIEITYYYGKKIGQVEVVYVDEEGNEFIKEDLSGRVDEAYEIKLKEIENYKVKEIQGELKGNFGLEKQIVKIVMEKIKGTVLVNMFDEEGNLLGQLEGEGYVGDIFEVELPAKEGYYIDGDNIITVEYIDGEILINVTYIKIPEPPVEPEPPATGDINVVILMVTMVASIILMTKVLLKKSEN